MTLLNMEAIIRETAILVFQICFENIQLNYDIFSRTRAHAFSYTKIKA